MISFETWSASSFHTPRCGPGRYRCSGVPSRRSCVILRPYIPSTLPSSREIGNTTEPLKCSWPDSRKMPSCCRRPRDLGAALAVLFRQPVAERAVGEAQLEVVDHLRMREPAPLRGTSALPGFASASRGSNRPPGAKRAGRQRSPRWASRASPPPSFPWRRRRRRRPARDARCAAVRPRAGSSRRGCASPSRSPSRPAWHAPRQCHRFFAGLTTSDGS